MYTHHAENARAQSRPYTYLLMNDGRWYGTRKIKASDRKAIDADPPHPFPPRLIQLDDEMEPVIVFPLTRQVPLALTQAAHLSHDVFVLMNKQVKERMTWNRLHQLISDYAYYIAGKDLPVLRSVTGPAQLRPISKDKVAVTLKGVTYLIDEKEFNRCELTEELTGKQILLGTILEMADWISKQQAA